MNHKVMKQSGKRDNPWDKEEKEVESGKTKKKKTR